MFKTMILKLFTRFFIFLTLAIALAACGGGGGAGTTTPPIGDVTGRWTLTENVDPTACGDAPYSETYGVDVTQSGSSVTLTDPLGVDAPAAATLIGNNLTFTNTSPEGIGSVTSNVSLFIAADCNSATGSSNWIYTDATTSCPGTTQLTATRDNPVGCGAGGGGGGTTGALDGTWNGTIEDPAGGVETLSVTFSGSDITSISVGGTNDGLTGTITQESSNVFGLTLTDGTEGGFIADIARQHLAFVDDSFFFGVLQKGAGAQPSFVQADLAGTASGVVVTTDFITFQEFTGNITCDSVGSCTGSDTESGSFTADLFLDHPLGRWSGLTNSGTGFASVFLTADKLFAGAWGCEAAFPDGCSFSAWSY